MNRKTRTISKLTSEGVLPHIRLPGQRGRPLYYWPDVLKALKAMSVNRRRLNRPTTTKIISSVPK